MLTPQTLLKTQPIPRPLGLGLKQQFQCTGKVITKAQVVESIADFLCQTMPQGSGPGWAAPCGFEERGFLLASQAEPEPR